MRVGRVSVLLSTTVAALTLSTAALSMAAPSDPMTQLIRDEMSRWPSDAASNSGHTVEEECGQSGWQKAKARLKVSQQGTKSRATIIMWQAKPNTLYTVWVRLRGTSPDGVEIGGSPMSGGGATPLLPGHSLDEAIGQSPPLPGTPDPVNGFTTDRRGRATWSVDLDFPLVGGAYPFHRAGDEAVADLIDAGSGWPLARTPTAIFDPRESALSGPFFIRVVSHCQDGLSHGLSPANRETWFQYP